MQQYSLSLELEANNVGAMLMRDAGGAMRPTAPYIRGSRPVLDSSS